MLRTSFSHGFFPRPWRYWGTQEQLHKVANRNVLGCVLLKNFLVSPLLVCLASSGICLKSIKIRRPFANCSVPKGPHLFALLAFQW